METMVVPIVMVCGEWMVFGDEVFSAESMSSRRRPGPHYAVVMLKRGLFFKSWKTDGGPGLRRDDVVLPEQLELILISPRELHPMTGLKREEIFAINMRLHFPYLFDIDDG